MVEPLKINKRRSSNIINFINQKQYIYFTSDNKRIEVKDLDTLKKLMKECSFAAMKQDGTDIKGLLFVWVSRYNGNIRYYVKFVYDTKKDLEDLLVYLNWHVSKEVYCKIDKESEAIKVLRTKGFHICADRNKEALLFRTENTRRFYVPIKEEDKLDE